MTHHTDTQNKTTKAKLLRMALLGSAALSLSAPALAQDNNAETDTSEAVNTLDTIVVTGSRATIQSSIDLKRSSTQIVDGLSAEEIGDLPALSIGEALENITGAASHRENGGATEVSIRGLGPYLSSTVVNGRAATNGSGDRSVNFSQFPSELMNKLAIFKTQDASQIEGGVAGQIQLDTLKPLDYGKRRFQFDLKGNVNPDQLNQNGTTAGDIGYRGTVSYVDQFETGAGRFGISLGAQRSDISQPEAESRQTSSTSSSRPACLITNGLAQYTDNLNDAGGQFTGFTNTPGSDRGDDDCDDFNDRNGDSSSDIPDGSTAQLFEDQRGSDTEGYDTSINPDTGLAVDDGTAYVFAPSQRHYRQNDTHDTRDAIFGAVQWQPNDRLDVNIDAQYSKRSQNETRNDLTFNGWRRNDTSLNLSGIGGDSSATTLDTLGYTDSGAVYYQVTDNSIEVQGGEWERTEEYLGLGLNVAYDITDRLSVAADFASSKTTRVEFAKEFRIQSDITPVIVYDETQGDVPVYTLLDEEFDVNDHDNYVDRLRVRIDNDLDRENTIDSARFDVKYDLDTSIFTTVEAGLRFANQGYVSLGGGADSGDPLAVTSGRFSFEIENDGELTINNQEVIDDSNDDGPLEDQFNALQDNIVGIIGSTNAACRTTFAEDDFLGSVSNGALVTNIDDDGTVLSSTNTWGTFDASCVADTSAASLNSLITDINAYLTNSDAEENTFDDGALGAISSAIPGLIKESSRTIDVEEVTTALYAMTGYETTLGGMPLSGNFGLRVVKTDVTSTSYRPELIINESDGEFSLEIGDSTFISEEHDYTEILPSATAILEPSDNVLLRFGIFKGMSRPDPADMAYSRTINVAGVEEGEVITSPEDLISSISANGNPSFDPLVSWNYDASAEWYPNDDSILALGVYYKDFQGGFENIVQNETYNFGGTEVVFPVSVSQTSDDTSALFGVEFTGTHSFSYLPGLWSGFGAKVSYNYTDSDFEFEDSRYGNGSVTQLDGTVVATNVGIIAPAGLPGLSQHTASAQIYYQAGPFDAQINYKYRDDYFQPFTSDGTRLRYIGDVAVWEARASYELNDNLKLSVEAINLFSEPKEQYAYVSDDLYEVNDYGPRVFFGIRGKF